MPTTTTVTIDAAVSTAADPPEWSDISSRKSNSNLESPIKKREIDLLLPPRVVRTWCDRCSISKKRQQPAASASAPQKEEVRRTKSFAGYTHKLNPSYNSSQ